MVRFEKENMKRLGLFGRPARFSDPEFFTNLPLKGSDRKRTKRRRLIEACVIAYLKSCEK